MTTLETQQTVNTLAARWCELVIEQERLITLIKRPVCGKPGHGFKAAYKAEQAKREIDQQLAAQAWLADNWSRRNGKASKEEREKRWGRYIDAIRAWNPA